MNKKGLKPKIHIFNKTEVNNLNIVMFGFLYLENE
jgi:hypothetical protein